MKQLTIISQVLVALILIPLSALAQQQVPFGSEVSDKVFHYHRHTPYIATSGNLADGAMAELTDHGFKTIIDFRTEMEGIDKDQDDATNASIRYLSMPVGREFPDAAFFERFAAEVENSEQYPMLLRCASANRVAMVWAAYQLQRGVSYEQALLEAQTIGIRAANEKKLAEFWSQMQASDKDLGSQ